MVEISLDMGNCLLISHVILLSDDQLLLFFSLQLVQGLM